jgi:hypothetical protein
VSIAGAAPHVVFPWCCLLDPMRGKCFALALAIWLWLTPGLCAPAPSNSAALTSGSQLAMVYHLRSDMLAPASCLKFEFKTERLIIMI